MSGMVARADNCIKHFKYYRHYVLWGFQHAARLHERMALLYDLEYELSQPIYRFRLIIMDLAFHEQKGCVGD